MHDLVKLLGAFGTLCGTTLIAYFLTPLTMRLAARLGAMDQPNARKLHTVPIPRLGGLAIVFAAATGLAATWYFDWPLSVRDASPILAGLGLGLLPILLVSFIDDIRPLPAVVKLAGHVVGAAIGVYFGIRLHPEVHLFGVTISLGILAIPLTILWLVGVTNAFNIIDGLDGLAAGQALISCASLAAIAAMSSRGEVATIGAIVSAALLGFLPFNLHPARTFLGDSGATALGYVVACLALNGGLMLSSGFAILLPVLVVGIPVVDTLVAVLRRASARLMGDRDVRMFTPDRDHIHHRVLAAGGSQRAAVVTLLGVAAVLVLVGFSSLILSNRASEILLIFVIWAGISGVIKLDYREFALIRRGGLVKVFDTAPIQQGVALLLIDLLLVAFSVSMAIGLKLNLWMDGLTLPVFAAMTVTLCVTTTVVFWFFGMYRWVWRLADMNDLRQAALAVMISGLLALFLHETMRLRHAPRSMYGIAVMIQLCGVVASRLAYRILGDWQRYASAAGRPTLVYGAGYHGSVLTHEFLHNPEWDRKVVGFIDDNPLKIGRVLNGIDILGGVNDIRAAIARTHASSVIVSSKQIPEANVEAAIAACAAAGVECLRFDVNLLAVPVVRAGDR